MTGGGRPAAGGIVDVGAGPALVFGGPCSNLQATEALFAEAARLGVPEERMVCAGDVVGCCGDPAATARRLMQSGVTVVAGDRAAMAAATTDDWQAHVDAELAAAPDLRCWLADLPASVELRIAGRRLLVTHAAPGADNRSVFPSDGLSAKRRLIAAGGLDGVVAGHAGLPFAQVVDGRLWLNAGAVGLPANDGTPRTWHALLRSRPDGLEIELRPLAYDHAAAAAAMAAKGVAPAYAEALLTGRWPSEDVLPAAERSRAGQPLAPRRLFWPAAPIRPAAPGRTPPERV